MPIGGPLILASLTIDGAGVVSGMGQVVNAFNQGERVVRDKAGQMERVTQALEGRFISIRSIAAAFLGGFTVAGAVFAIGNLTRELISNTAVFKQAAGEVTRWWTELTTGKSISDQLTDSLRKQAAALDLVSAAEQAGVKHIAQQDLIRSFTEQIAAQRQVLVDMKESAAAAVSGTSRIPAMYRQTIPLAERELSIQQEIARLIARRSASLNVLNGQEPNIPSGIAPEAAKVASAIRITTDEVIMAEKQWDDWNAVMEANGQILLNAPEVLSVADGGFEAHLNALDAVMRKYEEFGAVASQALGLVDAAATSGVLSQGIAARLSMVILAVQATMHGMFEVAAAVASAAVFDYRGAVLHKIAAGLYFATAAFHGIGAITGGTGGGGGGGSGSNRIAQATAPPSGSGPQINFYFDGAAILGTSKEALARDLTVLIKRALKDGVAGGTFDLSTEPA